MDLTIVLPKFHDGLWQEVLEHQIWYVARAAASGVKDSRGSAIREPQPVEVLLRPLLCSTVSGEALVGINMCVRYLGTKHRILKNGPRTFNRYAAIGIGPGQK